MNGMPTWRPSKMCSRVCGIGPSAAFTTRIAPSICAAPVIMFFHVVGVAGAVDMRVVAPPRSRIPHARSKIVIPRAFSSGRAVDLVVGPELAEILRLIAAVSVGSLPWSTGVTESCRCSHAACYVSNFGLCHDGPP